MPGVMLNGVGSGPSDGAWMGEDMLTSEAYSREADAVRGPFLRRLPSAALGTIVLAAMFAALISARTIPFSFGLILVAMLVSAAAAGRLSRSVARLDLLTAALVAFPLWSAATALWSEDPGLALIKSGMALLFLVAALVLVRLARRESTMNALHLADGVWMGLLIGLTYFFIELVSDQAIKMWVYNMLDLGPEQLKPLRHFTFAHGDIVDISPIDLTRNTAPISLFIWPAAIAAAATAPRRLRTPLSVGLVLLAVVVIVLSTHETSKLAIVVGLVAYALARLSHRWAFRLMSAAWLACCLLIVPAALLAHRADLHNAPWLQSSAQHRIIIWNHTAEQTLQRNPLFGIGANMTHILGPRLRDATDNTEGEVQERTLSRHAHNVFLQTWFELGAVGAVLLAIAGVAILAALRRLDRAVRPHAFALFASASVMALASYGMWQIWFMAMFATAPVMFATAHRARTGPVES